MMPATRGGLNQVVVVKEWCMDAIHWKASLSNLNANIIARTWVLQCAPLVNASKLELQSIARLGQ